MKKSTEVAPSWGQRIVGLEGLRAIAALAVLVYHVGHIYVPGAESGSPETFLFLEQGLTLFFVLSGFLLFWPFAARILERRELPHFRTYAFNRAIRIYPAYVVVLVIVAFVMQSAMRPDQSAGTLGVRSFLLNATLLQNYSPTWIFSGLEVSWTLTAEVTFYAALPLLAFAAARLTRRIRPLHAVIAPVAFMIVFGLAMRVVLIQLARHVFPLETQWSNSIFGVVSRSMFAQADLFGIGMAASLVYIAFRQGLVHRRYVPVVRAFLAAGGVVAVILFLYGIQPRFSSFVAAFGFACVLLLVVLPTRDDRHSRWALALDWRPVRYIGVISFSIYLWHLALVRFLTKHHVTFGGGFHGFVCSTLVILGLSIVLASATYFAVERPALLLKKRNRPLEADVPALAEPSRGLVDNGSTSSSL